MIFNPVTVTLGAMAAKKFWDSTGIAKKHEIETEVQYCLETLEKIGSLKRDLLEKTVYAMQYVYCVHHRYYRTYPVGGKPVEMSEDWLYRYNDFRRIRDIFRSSSASKFFEEIDRLQKLAAYPCSEILCRKYKSGYNEDNQDLKMEVIKAAVLVCETRIHLYERLRYDDTVSDAVSQMNRGQFDNFLKALKCVSHCCEEWLRKNVSLDWDFQFEMEKPQQDDLLKLRKRASNQNKYDYRTFSEEEKQKLFNAENMIGNASSVLLTSLQMMIPDEAKRLDDGANAIHQKRK